ncbi:Protein FAR1-RELATED SEQUENCE [Psidium guajava]|nr:Protein FAR1-RELATED SEQUENCE [Psidium guajava]
MKKFARLVNLRFLKLDEERLVGDFENTFSKLRWLSWYHCPPEFQATNLKLRNLVVLELSGIYITGCWSGWDHIKVAKYLKILSISVCEYLTTVPNFSAFSTSERFILEDCESLVEIDSSIGELKCLVYLEINGRNSMEELPVGSCLDSLGLVRLHRELSVSAGELNSLIDLPESIGKLKRLNVLRVKHTKIGKLPDSIGGLESLLELDMSRTEITDLPDSIGDLGRLEVISMSCSKIRKLPDSIGRVESLLQLDLSLTKITDLPDVIGDLKLLKEINVDWSEIRQLPKAIGIMGNLEKLLARCCRNLQGEVPSEISGLSFLRILNLSKVVLVDCRQLSISLLIYKNFICNAVNIFNSCQGFPRV